MNFYYLFFPFEFFDSLLISFGANSAVNYITSRSQGFAIVNMLCNWIGFEDFRKGLRSYIKEFQWGNSTTEQLWAHFERTSGKDVANVMSRWTKQTGFPLVDVQTVPDSSTFRIQQRRYRVEDECTWPIPLTWIVKDLETLSGAAFVDEKESQVVIPRSPNAVVKFNSGQVGFFRVKYSKQFLEKLAEAYSSFSEIDRSGIMNDVLSLASSGEQTLQEAFAFVAVAGPQERGANALSAFGGTLVDYSMLVEETAGEAFAKFCQEVISPAVEFYGWESKPGEHFSYAQARSVALGVAGRFGYKPVVEEALRITKHYLETGVQLNSQIFDVAVRTACSFGGSDVFSGLFDQLRGEKDLEIASTLLFALASTRQSECREALLQGFLSGAVRLQDAYIVSRCMVRTQAGRLHLLGWLKRHWSDIQMLSSDNGIVLKHFLQVSFFFSFFSFFVLALFL